jgi:hypothetical protein
MSEKEYYKKILFSLVFRFLKEKNLVGEFIKYSYEFHSLERSEYELPENICTKDRVKFVLSYNVSSYMQSYWYTHNINFKSKINPFFQTYEGSFSWIDTVCNEIWTELDIEWRNVYIPREIDKLIKMGVKL